MFGLSGQVDIFATNDVDGTGRARREQGSAELEIGELASQNGVRPGAVISAGIGAGSETGEDVHTVAHDDRGDAALFVELQQVGVSRHSFGAIEVTGGRGDVLIRDRTTFTPHPRQRDPGIQAIGSENVGIGVDLFDGLAISLNVGEGRRSAGETGLGEQILIPQPDLGVGIEGQTVVVTLPVVGAQRAIVNGALEVSKIGHDLIQGSQSTGVGQFRHPDDVGADQIRGIAGGNGSQQLLAEVIVGDGNRGDLDIGVGRFELRDQHIIQRAGFGAIFVISVPEGDLHLLATGSGSSRSSGGGRIGRGSSSGLCRGRGGGSAGAGRENH